MGFLWVIIKKSSSIELQTIFISVNTTSVYPIQSSASGITTNLFMSSTKDHWSISGAQNKITSRHFLICRFSIEREMVRDAKFVLMRAMVDVPSFLS